MNHNLNKRQREVALELYNDQHSIARQHQARDAGVADKDGRLTVEAHDYIVDLVSSHARHAALAELGASKFDVDVAAGRLAALRP